MAGKKPDYRVFISRKGEDKQGDEKNFYTEIGAAWKVAEDGISIQLNAVPVDGRLVLFPLREE
jgi:hypothetical protein